MTDRTGDRRPLTESEAWGEVGLGKFGETGLGVELGVVGVVWENELGVAGAQPVWCGQRGGRSAERRSWEEGALGKGTASELDRGRVVCGEAGGAGKQQGTGEIFLRGLRLGL
jgi:hypothetical protein